MSEPWDRAFRGDLEGLDHLSDDPCWRLCREGHRALMGRAPVPSPASFAAFAHAPPEVRAVAALGVCLVARHAMLAFDRPAFDEALAVARRLEAGCGSTRAAQWVELLGHWGQLFDGPCADLPPRVDALATSASRGRFAELVVEANVLRAAVALELDDLPSAIALTRRASRMARAEGMPHEEYLAHAFLARARRRAERAHLASRILGALFSAAPAPFHAWLGWEQRLSGEPLPASVGGPGRLAQRLIDGWLEGEALPNEALVSSTRGFAPHARETRALLEALDPRVVPREPGVVDWASGARLRLPLGLDFVASSTPNARVGLAGNAWVLVRPEGARRVLHPGIGLLGDLPILEQTARKHGRTELATAVLALAGRGGLAISQFVREVYGFAYTKDAHDGMLRVLIHRMRAGLRDVATVAIADDRIHLTSERAFLVPDPRTSPSSAEPVLRMIAVHPGASAREIAGALAIPLRTVQAVLNQLIADGSCLADRDAGGVAYRIEDTTFSDPTRTRTLDDP